MGERREKMNESYENKSVMQTCTQMEAKMAGIIVREPITHRKKSSHMTTVTVSGN